MVTTLSAVERKRGARLHVDGGSMTEDRKPRKEMKPKHIVPEMV